MTSIANPGAALNAPAAPGLAQRTGVLAFGLIAYALFLGTILYLIGFVGAWFVPKHVDNGPAGPVWLALLLDAALVLAFALQHEVMARPAFKQRITRVIPNAMERSVFVFLASAILIVLFVFWRPIPMVLWSVGGAPAVAITALALAGWVVVFASTFIINHFDLFGLRQVVLNMRNREYAPVGFKLRLFYKLCRHPLMLGFIIAFWAAPTMTVGRLWFATLMTLFILVGIRFEERDLEAAHGDDYRAYKRRVRALVPIPRRPAD